jgi:hypothetical protein
VYGINRAGPSLGTLETEVSFSSTFLF